MTHDSLDPQNLSGPKHHNPKVMRPSTRKGAAPKVAAEMNRSGDLSPTGPRRDPYLPKLGYVSGYDPRLQASIRVFAAADRRAQAAKKGRRK